MEKLWKQSKEGVHTDWVIVTSDAKTITVHRIVMATSVNYFKTLYSNAKWIENQMGMVLLPDISYDIMRSVVHFSYTGWLTDVTEDNFEDVLRAADRLDIPGILTIFREYIIKTLDITKCIGYYQMAIRYNLSETIEKIREYILCHFVTVRMCLLTICSK